MPTLLDFLCALFVVILLIVISICFVLYNFKFYGRYRRLGMFLVKTLRIPVVKREESKPPDARSLYETMAANRKKFESSLGSIDQQLLKICSRASNFQSLPQSLAEIDLLMFDNQDELQKRMIHDLFELRANIEAGRQVFKCFEAVILYYYLAISQLEDEGLDTNTIGVMFRQAEEKIAFVDSLGCIFSVPLEYLLIEAKKLRFKQESHLFMLAVEQMFREISSASAEDLQRAEDFLKEQFAQDVAVVEAFIKDSGASPSAPNA